MASASERRAQRELAEARASGNAPPEVDVKTGAMINPHNPEFITKKPWYLAEGGSGGGGGDSGPTLDHQADQRREEDKKTISLAEADAMVMRERERIKEKLRRQRQKLRGGRRGDDDGGDGDLFEAGMWIEALKKNKRPYLIAQIVRASLDKKRGEVYDLRYEDGYLERNVRPFGADGQGGPPGGGGRSRYSAPADSQPPRMRVTRTGSRAHSVVAGAGGSGGGGRRGGGRRSSGRRRTIPRGTRTTA